MVAHRLGHVLMAEGDKPISLLERALEHIRSTAEFNVYYGEGRDSYDLPGRTAHECVFNTNDGQFRCPNSQQGYTGFSTWTRGLSWAACGFAEELEFLETLPEEELTEMGGRRFWQELCLKAARATCDFYLQHTPVDGVPYWDTGAPNLHKLGDDYLDRPADPFNEHEPVDSTAAAITAQGLLRLGLHLSEHGQPEDGARYFQAGLTVAGRLFSDDYLSTDGSHQGLLLHSIYHRPNGWDQIPAGGKTPANESSMWGDYHTMELAIYLKRLAENGSYLTFF
jgi:hypothetical protein